MCKPTKRAICDALFVLLQENGMDSITVRMVCDHAGISRQALYNHYYSLLDVLNEELTRRLDRAIGEDDTYLTWHLGFEHILGCLRENRVLILHVYRSSCRGELLSMIERYGGRLISRGIDDCCRDLAADISAEDRAFMLRLYQSAFMGVIDYWLSQDMKPSPAYITSRCNAMMALSIQGTIHRLTDPEAPALQFASDVQRVDNPAAK